MRRLLLFAKRPRLGHVKTRLVPPLSRQEALTLYRAFLVDQVRFLRSFGSRCQIELWLDGPWPTETADEFGCEGLALHQQGPGDLGQRMLRAFRHSAAEGCGATVILGADAPTLPEGRVEGAFEALDRGSPAVIAPAEDGGYVLLGLRAPVARLFEDVPWGSAEVFAATVRRSRECGLELTALEPWYDVDDEAALTRLRGDLRAGAASRAPATARVLADLG